MPAIVFAVLQGLFLILLYVFVARAVRWVIRDVTAPPSSAVVAGPAPRRATKRPRAQPRELVIHFQQGAPRLLTLQEGTRITFGRHESATVVLADPYVSDFHARLEHIDGQWVLADEGSTNGTFLNQVKLTAPTPLQAGDQVAIGRTTVEVRR